METYEFLKKQAEKYHDVIVLDGKKYIRYDFMWWLRDLIESFLKPKTMEEHATLLGLTLLSYWDCQIIGHPDAPGWQFENEFADCWESLQPAIAYIRSKIAGFKPKWE